MAAEVKPFAVDTSKAEDRKSLGPVTVRMTVHDELHKLSANTGVPLVRIAEQCIEYALGSQQTEG